MIRALARITDKDRTKKFKRLKRLDPLEKSTINRKSLKSLGSYSLKKYFPDEPCTSVLVRWVHPDLITRFRIKCYKHRYSMSGMLRRLLVDFVDYRFDWDRIKLRLKNTDPLKSFGKFPHNKTGKTFSIKIPHRKYVKLKKWCARREVSISWQTKRLMIAYILDYIR